MEKHLILRAACGRVILRFPEAMAESSGGVLISEGSRQRLELAAVYDVGAALNEADEEHRDWLLAQQASDRPVMADFGAGVSLWKSNYDLRWKWLRDYRIYTLSQPFLTIEEVSEEVAATDPRVVTLTTEERKDSLIVAPTEAAIDGVSNPFRKGH